MKQLLATVVLAGLVMPGVPGAAAESDPPLRPAAQIKIKPEDAKKLREILRITLDVREGSGDFTDWVQQGGIAQGALVKQFRWKTSATGVAGARYQVVQGTFPAGQGSTEPPNLVKTGVLALPPGPNAYGVFKIDFWPVLRESVGTEAPATPVTFSVRIVLVDAGSQPLPPASTPVKVTYAPPADGTIFSGSSMVVRLQTVKCIKVTDGPGGDDLDVTVIARPRNGAPAKVLYWKAQDIDDGEAFHPSKLLWTFDGLSFKPDADIIVVVQEDDGPGFQAGIQPPVNNVSFDETLTQAACTSDHDCIGPPQTLPVTAADWHAVAVKKQTLTRTLTFKGRFFLVVRGKSEWIDVGGHYEVTFQLAPK